MPEEGSIVFGLLLFAVCFLSGIYGSGDYVPKKVDIPKHGNVKIYSDSDIAKYNGRHPARPIYMAVKGVVFDVTEGKKYYGLHGPYNQLAGKDASRAVAKMSLEPQDLTHDVSTLTNKELKSLDDIFESTYMAKYPIIGYMDYLMNANGGITMNDPGRSFTIGDATHDDEF